MSANRCLEQPPIAQADSRAIEVLSVWAAPDGPQQFALRTNWNDPGVWGLLLVDAARHVAKAYANEGMDFSIALNRIRAFWDAEFDSPTDLPEQIIQN